MTAEKEIEFRVVGYCRVLSSFKQKEKIRLKPNSPVKLKSFCEASLEEVKL